MTSAMMRSGECSLVHERQDRTIECGLLGFSYLIVVMHIRYTHTEYLQFLYLRVA